MRFKVGDKVQFLNETGGGIITAVLDNKLVKIKTEDGFEMPVLSNELIFDYRGQEIPEKGVASPFGPAQPAAKKEEVAQEPESEEMSEINPFGKAREEEGLYLVFEPHNQQWLLTGEVDVYLVNHTPFGILYNLFLNRSGKLKGVDYGSVEAESKLLLATVSRDELDDWNKGTIQFLFHEEEPQTVIFPLHTSIDIRPNRFFKEGSYRSNTLVDGKALISVLALRAAFQVADGGVMEQKFDASTTKSKSEVKIEAPFIDRYKTKFREAVVDLHIGEVVDNITGMSSRDMLEAQVKRFKKALDSAIANGYQKVTFIHGVGNGVLKNAIIEEMKTYENLENSMASITKFGVGALDVLIHDAE